MTYADRDDIQRHIAEAGGAMSAVESELQILGVVLASAHLRDDIFARLPDAAFSEPVIGRVISASRALHLTNHHISPSFIADRLGNDPGFEQRGGVGWLENLAETMSTAGIRDHVEAVADRATRRDLRRVAAKLAAGVSDLTAGTAADLLAETERDLGEVAASGASPEAWFTAADAMRAALHHSIHHKGVIEYPIGLREVDGLTGGLPAGVTIIGAATGMGKTIGGMQVAKANANEGKGTCFFSLEMGQLSVGARFACDYLFDRANNYYLGEPGSPTMKRVMGGKMTPYEIERYEAAIEVYDRLPLFLDETPGLTLSQIETRARRQHRRFLKQGIKPGPIIIDHLGKVKASKDRRGDRTQELADTSNGCLEMSKRLGVPVVGLAQINRNVDSRSGEDKRPQLGDIQQSSAIAQDARLVIFLYRPEYYIREAMEHQSFEKQAEMREKLEAVKHRLYWIVDKNNDGPKGQVTTFCEAACSAVRDWSRQDDLVLS